MNKTFSIVISNDSAFTAEDIESAAGKYGLSRNAFIMTAISFLMNMDPITWKQLRGLSDFSKVSTGQLVNEAVGHYFKDVKYYMEESMLITKVMTRPDAQGLINEWERLKVVNRDEALLYLKKLIPEERYHMLMELHDRPNFQEIVAEFDRRQAAAPDDAFEYLKSHF